MRTTATNAADDVKDVTTVPVLAHNGDEHDDIGATPGAALAEPHTTTEASGDTHGDQGNGTRVKSEVKMPKGLGMTTDGMCHNAVSTTTTVSDATSAMSDATEAHSPEVTVINATGTVTEPYP
ncbi:hypothetical protein PInf_006710 [Phytophthora infestans]|nr:hypothetical protein PInf_006710 [Phytophthora infestans]